MKTLTRDGGNVGMKPEKIVITVLLVLLLAGMSIAVDWEELYEKVKIYGSREKVFTQDSSGALYANVTNINIDDVSNSQVTINSVHHGIHEGEHYYIRDYVQLESGQHASLVFATPNTSTLIHMEFSLSSTGQTKLEVYENATTHEDGVLETSFNSNRNYPDASVLTIYANSSITTPGYIISQTVFGVTSNPAQSMGDSVSRENELVLRQGTNYTFNLTSESNGNIISYIANWYEHEG